MVLPGPGTPSHSGTLSRKPSSLGTVWYLYVHCHCTDQTGQKLPSVPIAPLLTGWEPSKDRGKVVLITAVSLTHNTPPSTQQVLNSQTAAIHQPAKNNNSNNNSKHKPLTVYQAPC